MQLNINNYIIKQQDYEKLIASEYKKRKGIFFTNNIKILELILKKILADKDILRKKFFEPSCGHGIFITTLIIALYKKFPHKEKICNFIENNIFFNDIDLDMTKITMQNIKELFFILFDEHYNGKFNYFNFDFTIKQTLEKNIELQYNTFDYIIGNPPYISLYGRRDQKRNEEQRIYYLKNYEQFPKNIKNGKINYIMLFIEHSLNFLKNNGSISFIVDLSFFETAFKYTRKFLLECTRINEIVYNINTFKNVGSGQIIISITKGYRINNKVEVLDYKHNKSYIFNQDKWNNANDEYRFRIEENCEKSNKIVEKIFAKNDKTLKDLYPNKNLRTCVMLLNLEDNFVFEKNNLRNDISFFPYYQGSKSLKYKYSKLYFEKYFYYDKQLQDKINNELKIKLAKKGVKNKKRIGFGELEIYNNPKIYIRQSAKEIIATYDENKSSANNSLYVFSLRDNSEKSKQFLLFLTGLLNSKLITFFAQKRRIIRYHQGKQPQIKISDLYQIPILNNQGIQKQIALFVKKIYKKPLLMRDYQNQIDNLIFRYYNLSKVEISNIEKSIVEFSR